MKFTLVEKQLESEDITSFFFKPEAPITWKAGQYFHYVLEHENPDDRGVERWFTCAAAPFEQNIRITTRFAGEKSSSFKKAFFAIPIGGTIEADGPLGDFTVVDSPRRYTFIVGGIGITPLRSIFAQLAHDNQMINGELFYANRDDKYIFEDELNKFASSQPGFKWQKFTDPKLIEENDIRKIVLDINEPLYYISGPKPMAEHYDDVLRDMGVLDTNIKLDDFPGYDKI